MSKCANNNSDCVYPYQNISANSTKYNLTNGALPTITNS